MKYSNLQIIKELKYIKKCFLEGKTLDQKADKIYKTKNIGLTNYLVEKKYVNMNNCSNGRDIPFISPYGEDFLKKSFLNCLFEDYKEIILVILTIIGIILTIIGIIHT